MDDDEMKRIVRCRYCGKPEYYGEMRWLSGKCCCRQCYKADYQKVHGKPYTWDDLDGPTPSEEDLLDQCSKDGLAFGKTLLQTMLKG